MKENWLDIQHRGYAAYLGETENDEACQKFNRAVLCAKSTAEQFDTVYLDCQVHTDWIEQIEAALPFIENAVRQARQFILRQGQTVPVEKAKRVSRASVEHLSRHSELISSVPLPQEELRPEKIYVTENIGTYTVYENRFLYMLLRYLLDFAGLRYQKITELAAACSTNLQLNRQITEDSRKISFSLCFSEISQGMEGGFDSQAAAPLQRIRDILQTTQLLLRTELMQEVSAAPMLKPPIAQTNVMLHDQNFKEAFALYSYLVAYTGDGYEKLERYRQCGPLTGETNRELSGLVAMTSYLSYLSGGLRQELDARFQAEEARRKEEAERQKREKLAEMRSALGPIGPAAAEYIQALEQRLETFDEMQSALELERTLHAQAQAETESARNQANSLQESNHTLAAQLRGANETLRASAQQLAALKDDTEKLRQDSQAQLEEQRQRFEGELDAQKQEFLREYALLAEKYRLSKARNRVLAEDDESCCTREAFAELEKEYEAFRRFYKKQWKLAKNQIRKETLRNGTDGPKEEKQ